MPAPAVRGRSRRLAIPSASGLRSHPTGPGPSGIPPHPPPRESGRLSHLPWWSPAVRFIGRILRAEHRGHIRILLLHGRDQRIRLRHLVLQLDLERTYSVLFIGDLFA